MSSRITVGQIVGAFGIKGLVKVESKTTFATRFEPGNEVFIAERKFKIETCQVHKGRFLLGLTGIKTMTQAEELQWQFLEASGQPKLQKGEYFVEDLVGLTAVTEGGEPIGIVTAVKDFPAHEVIYIDDVIMVPMVSEFIKKIDTSGKTMTVRLIYGMRPGEE